jgi:hypothetical protein
VDRFLGMAYAAPPLADRMEGSLRKQFRRLACAMRLKPAAGVKEGDWQIDHKKRGLPLFQYLSPAARWSKRNN